MRMPTATVTSKGQITIPVEVRRSLGLELRRRVGRTAPVLRRAYTVTFDSRAARLTGTELVPQITESE